MIDAFMKLFRSRFRLRSAPLRARALRRAGAASVLTVVLLSGCDESPLRPEPPTTANVFFSSRLARGGETWRSFTTDVSGSVTVQLSVLLPQAQAVVDLGIGTFAETTCTITHRVETAPGAEPQISETLPAGSYCVRIADIGNLTGNNDFALTVVIPLR